MSRIGTYGQELKSLAKWFQCYAEVWRPIPYRCSKSQERNSVQMEKQLFRPKQPHGYGFSTGEKKRWPSSQGRVFPANPSPDKTIRALYIFVILYTDNWLNS